MDRTDNGRALPGTDVVGADALALLSGVSFNSTVKVMLALGAMKEASGHDFDTILRPEALPLELAHTERRKDATTEFVHRLLHHPEVQRVKRELKLARFD